MRCPLCQADFVPCRTFDFSDYSIITCPGCLVRFSRPFIDNSAVYDERVISEKELYLESANIGTAAARCLQPYLDISGKRVLDIGCGAGSFLEKMKANNEVLGVELSSSYSSILIKKGIPHRIGELSSILAGLPDSYYDLITLWDVFEHFQDPDRMLSIIKEKLSPSGFIINWANNYDDFISLFASIIYSVSFGKLKYFMDLSFNRGSGHNYNFVSQSLEKVYNRHGLRIVETIHADTPSKRLSSSMIFRLVLELFYAANAVTGKGKIICHVLSKI